VSQKCHKSVTKVSQKCHKSVTKVSQKCHKRSVNSFGITRALLPPVCCRTLEKCYKSVTQGCQTGSSCATKVSHGCVRKAVAVLQKCHMGVLQKCHKSVTKVSHRAVRQALAVLQKCHMGCQKGLWTRLDNYLVKTSKPSSQGQNLSLGPQALQLAHTQCPWLQGLDGLI
jgi:hypothetical protein